jgi:hypothetical protein
MSIGKAMKTSFPVGWSSDNDRLSELAVDGAGVTDEPADSCIGVMDALPPPL